MLSRTYLVFTDKDIHTESFSRECCRSMIALMDVSFVSSLNAFAVCFEGNQAEMDYHHVGKTHIKKFSFFQISFKKKVKIVNNYPNVPISTLRISSKYRCSPESFKREGVMPQVGVV